MNNTPPPYHREDLKKDGKDIQEDEEKSDNSISLSSFSLNPETCNNLEVKEFGSHNQEFKGDACRLTPSYLASEKSLSRKSTKLEDKLAKAHDNILLKRDLIICFSALSGSLFVSFCDQSSVTIALPIIAKDLNAANSINWAGTASLLANTVCQVLYGRLSDIYGRKSVLLISIIILFVANLLCGFAESGPEFYVFRALAGIGAGGVQSLTMVIASDSVTLKERGKFQGILGTSVGLGNVVGPLVMGSLVERSTWRNFYRIFPGIIALMFVIVIIFVKDKPKTEAKSILSNKQKLMKIDYGGLFLSCAGLTLVLVPLSGGGSTFPWDSTLVIVMFVVGGVCLVMFTIYELRVPELPMIPLKAMKNATLSILLVSNFLFGAAYYGFFFIMPYYFQIVRGDSAMRSAVLFIPLLMTQSVMSTIAGTLMSLMGQYIYIIAFGYVTWITGVGMTWKWGLDTSVAYITGTLCLIGTGAGFIFQPSIVAIQANCKKSQRAVIIGFRNVLRSFGGAFGITIASLIVTNSLNTEIKTEMAAQTFPDSFLESVKAHIFMIPNLEALSSTQVVTLHEIYMKSIRNSFYFLVPALVLCFMTCFVVKDNGLQCVDEVKEPEIEIVDKV